MDAAERERIYREANQIIRDDAPFLWLHTIDELYGVRDTVQGFVPRVEPFVWAGDLQVQA